MDYLKLSISRRDGVSDERSFYNSISVVEETVADIGVPAAIVTSLP